MCGVDFSVVSAIQLRIHIFSLVQLSGKDSGISGSTRSNASLPGNSSRSSCDMFSLYFNLIVLFYVSYLGI